MEAHPDQDFPEGENTSDMGWPEDECAETGSQEDRARRAKLLKEMYGCEYLLFGADNDQNTIKTEFMGGGFYSGFVIDTDKTIIEKKNWAWVASDFDWYGLPLADIADLYEFLEEYFNPSPPEEQDTDSEDGDGAEGDGGGTCSTIGTGKHPVGVLAMVLTLLGL